MNTLGYTIFKYVYTNTLYVNQVADTPERGSRPKYK